MEHGRKHFDRVFIVSTPDDVDTAHVAIAWMCELFTTNAFSENPVCPFAKDRAIVEALKYLGPCGWTLLMDADILLPDSIQWPELNPRFLYSARRRMCLGLEPGKDWNQYPVLKDIVFAGYFQLFHSDDPNLQPWPNYPTERLVWYSDTVFQDRWPPNQKRWLPFEVMHIGDPPRQNWLGRSEEAKQRLRLMLRDPNNIKWKSKWLPT